MVKLKIMREPKFEEGKLCIQKKLFNLSLYDLSEETLDYVINMLQRVRIDNPGYDKYVFENYWDEDSRSLDIIGYKETESDEDYEKRKKQYEKDLIVYKKYIERKAKLAEENERKLYKKLKKKYG